MCSGGVLVIFIVWGDLLYKYTHYQGLETLVLMRGGVLQIAHSKFSLK
jgi:hypothetical protein